MNFLEQILQKSKEIIVPFIAEFSNQMFSSPLGNKASNIEIAIASCKLAKKMLYSKKILYNSDKLNKHLGWIQNLLGCAYCSRRKGERAKNLEIAIKAFKLALKLRSREKFPEKWAETQKNLGTTYSCRIRGNKANNLKEAIKAFKLALKVCTPKSQLWPRLQNEIGNVYLKIEKEGKVDSLLKEAAIKAFESALQVYSSEKNPYEWAITQNNLGNVYRQRKKGDRDENMEKAIKAFNSALEKLDKNYYDLYGRIQNNLGSTYLEKRNGDKNENLELAIQTFKSVLQIYIDDDSPQELAIILGNMGKAYLSAENYTKAYEAFADSINIGNFLRWEIILGSGIESDKQNLAEAWNHHYQGILEACLNLTKDQPDYFADAIEYAERSKVRNLVELVNKKKLYPTENCYSLNQELYQLHCIKLDSLRRKIFSKQWQKQSKEILKKFLQESNEQIKVIDTIIKRINTKLEKLMQERDKLIQEINKTDSNFRFTQKLNEIAFSEIKDLIDENTAIIEWYITNDKIITFIINQNEETEGEQQPLFWKSSPENLGLLIKWCKEYFGAYYAPRRKEHKEHKEDKKEDKEKKEKLRQELKQQWQSGLATRFQELAKILDIEKIVSHIPESCSRLILVPHRFLHLLPLHALPLGEQQDKCLLDKFKGGVSYTPSCQLLQISQGQQSKRTEFSKLFAVQNPNNDLPYAELEVDAICKFFSSSASEVLKNQDANEVALKVSENLPLSHCCHFACHGEFNLKSPVESALLLSEHKSSAKDQQLKEDGRLTLPEISRLTLDQCRLVTLSACETGMVDPDSISDEYIGLPSGFMFAGSPSVVASLWKASDISTIFLMSKFYQNLTEHRREFSQLEEGAVAIALNQAQCWLRDATSTELRQRMKDLSFNRTQKTELKRFFYNNYEKPFSTPYYWAAFCAIGQ